MIPTFKRVGFWKGGPPIVPTTASSGSAAIVARVLGALTEGLLESDLLDPKTLVDPAWDPTERAMVLEHLRRGRVHMGYMGFSECRFCGVPNGTKDMTDGVYLWPEGLPHYLTDHAVRLPAAFVEHVRSKRTRR